MKHHYFISGLGVLLAIDSLPAQAQADFRPGYLVRPAGDTVRGQVNYRGAHRGAQQCLFRATGEQATTTWLPAQLKGYGLLSGERFSSQLTPLPTPPASPGSPVPGPGEPARQLFLEVLADGPASLLSRKDDAGQEHFYVQKAGAAQPTELVQVRQQVPDGAGSREQVLPVYRGVLTEQFADCPAILLSISKTEFKASALTAAVGRYNECRQPGQVAPPSPKRAEVSLEVLVGGQASRTTYDFPAGSVKLPANWAPEVGVGLSLGRRLLRQKLTFRAELHYVRQVAEGSASETNYFGTTQTYALRFATAYLRLPILVRYAIPGTRVRPFAEVGASINYAPSIDAQRRPTNGGSSGGDWQPLVPGQVGPGNPFREYEFGLVAGLGVQFPGLLGGHSLALLGRAEQSNGFLLIGGYNTSVLRGNVLLSFNLTKN